VNKNPSFLDRQYGVVSGSVRDGLINPIDPSRYEIKLECDNGMFFRVSIRIASNAASTIRAFFSSILASVTKFNIPALAVNTQGFRPLETGMQIGEGMDYLRDGLFSAQQLQGMEQVGVSTAGICLANLLEAVVKRAIHSDGARLVAFGQAFKDLKPDRVFHHSPGWGLHDVHMMQGSSATPHEEQNRVYGDGAGFVWFPAERQLVALFILFAPQELVTDKDGNPANTMWQRP
jgi:uncharacterized protein YukJ